MKEKGKLNLSDLKVQSFVTSMKNRKQRALKGGATVQILDCTVGVGCECPSDGCGGGSAQCGSHNCTFQIFTCLYPC